MTSKKIPATGEDVLGGCSRRSALRGLGAMTAASIVATVAVPEQACADTLKAQGERGASAVYPAQGLDPTRAQIMQFLRLSNDVGRRAMSLGHHPFGAVLVAPDQKTVLLTQCNIDTVNHAESTLARVAATNFTPEYLWGCTLYTAVEPCCMCAGSIYWANIGRVVFGMTEAMLLQLTGNHHENPTMSVSSHYVFSHGQKAVKLIGPVTEIEQETAVLQKAFWLARK